METTSRAKTLGKYRLIAELGRGGMGIVYLAVAYGPGGFSKLLVVKELRPELAHESNFFQMFLDEARLAARLSHPNIVQTYEVGEEGGRYFMAMEYLEGQALLRVLSVLRRRGRSMPRAAQLRVLCDVLLGLHYAHELRGLDGQPLGVVHRDVSPHNIFLTYDGQIKLVDFGIAKALDARHETVTGTLKGKVTYMAPEQVVKEAPIDRRTDVFAAGAILWEALVGRKLWEGSQVNDVLLQLTKRELPPSPASLVHDVPPELDRICARAMAVDPADRYETALAFRSALEQYIQGSGEAASAHEVGHFVGEVFAEERATNRSLIETELTRASSGVPREQLASLTVPSGDQTPYSLPGLPSRPPAAQTLSRVGSSPVHSSLAFAAQPGTGATNPGGGSRRLLWLGVAAGLASAAVAAGATTLVRGKVLGPAPTAAAPVLTRPDASAPTAGDAKGDDAVLALNIRVTPASARVSLDEEVLAPDALASVRPRDKKPHKLYAEAEGYVPRTEIVVFDGPNVTVNLVLDRRPVPVAAPPRGRPPPPPPAAKPTPPRSAASAPGEATINPQGGKPPKRNVDPWNPYGGG